MSIAVTGGTLLSPMLAKLPTHGFHRRLLERWPFLDRYGDPQESLLDDPDIARRGLDLDFPLVNPQPESHTRLDSRFVPNCFGQHKASGRVKGCLNGISHGR